MSHFVTPDYDTGTHDEADTVLIHIKIPGAIALPPSSAIIGDRCIAFYPGRPGNIMRVEGSGK